MSAKTLESVYNLVDSYCYQTMLNTKKNEIDFDRLQFEKEKTIKLIEDATISAVAQMWVIMLLEALNMYPRELLSVLIDTSENREDCRIAPKEAVDVLFTTEGDMLSKHRLVRLLLVPLMDEQSELAQRMYDLLDLMVKENENV